MKKCSAWTLPKDKYFLYLTIWWHKHGCVPQKFSQENIQNSEGMPGCEQSYSQMKEWRKKSYLLCFVLVCLYKYDDPRQHVYEFLDHSILLLLLPSLVKVLIQKLCIMRLHVYSDSPISLFNRAAHRKSCEQKILLVLFLSEEDSINTLSKWLSHGKWTLDVCPSWKGLPLWLSR